VILYGQSIGGAVAIDLAARNPNVISGLIVENTFLSIVSDLFLPFTKLCVRDTHLSLLRIVPPTATSDSNRRALLILLYVPVPSKVGERDDDNQIAS